MTNVTAASMKFAACVRQGSTQLSTPKLPAGRGWDPETGREKVKTHNRLLRFPIILLVGTQIDLRQDRATLDKLADKNLTPISSKVGVKVAKQIGAAKYVKWD